MLGSPRKRLLAPVGMGGASPMISPWLGRCLLARYPSRFVDPVVVRWTPLLSGDAGNGDASAMLGPGNREELADVARVT